VCSSDLDPVTGHLQVTEIQSEAEWMSVVWTDPVTSEQRAMVEPYRDGITRMVIHNGRLHAMIRGASSTPFLWRPLYLADDGTGVDVLQAEYPGKANIVPIARGPNGEIDIGGTPGTERILWVETLDQNPNYITIVEFS